MNWESKVSPPPPGEWMKYVPKELRPEALPTYSFRVAYVIPSNRTMQTDAIQRLQYLVKLYHDFYQEQMDRNGFGPKSFQYETESDGVTPKVNIVYASNEDSYYRVDPWSRVSQAVQSAGYPVWSDGQKWMITYEAHVLNSDGSITGGFNGGASYDSANGGGVGMTASCTLALINQGYILDNRLYSGVTIPELGPYPLVYGVTAQWFDGNSVSSLSSVDYGIFMHEMGHAFYLWHDFNNDANFRGNLEGNGFRGARGYLYPQEYPDDEFRLSYGNALALNVSRFFNADSTFTDNTRPTASIVTTAGTQDLVDGLLGVRFTASDSGGLALALLRSNGNTIDQMILHGTNIDTTFYTPYYNAGTTNSFTVTVYDAQGNLVNADGNIIPSPGFSHAPYPFILAQPSMIHAGETMHLTAASSYDPDNNYPLMVEWDLDGDGQFDTNTTLYNTALDTTFLFPGTHLIRARLTNSAGLKSLSVPIAVRILEPETTDVDNNWQAYW